MRQVARHRRRVVWSGLYALGDSGRTQQSWPGAAQAGRPPGTQRAQHQGAQDFASDASRPVDAGPRPGARQAQIRADGAVALRLLSRRCAGHGRGFGRAPEHGHRQPAMRRRACAQPGRLCRTRRSPGLRHQRLRRDHPWTLRMGPEAHGRLHRVGRKRFWPQGRRGTTCRGQVR